MAQNGPARTSVRAHVLRIGVIRDARLVLERTLPLDSPVDLGGSHTALPLDGVPTHRLFTPLSTGNDDPLGLVVDDAIRPRTRPRRGELDATLAPGDRGRIDLPGGSGIVVLYQVVPAPVASRPQPVSAPDEVDLRPRWFDEDELPFVQSLALWSALGVLLGVFVATSPAPRTVSVDELPAYLATTPGPVYLPDETPSTPEPEVDDDAVAQVDKRAAEPRPRPDTPPEPLDIDDAVADAGTPPQPLPTDGERALAEQERRDALVNRFKKAGLLGTSGESTWAIDKDDAIAMDHLETHGEADLDALQGLRGPDGTGGGPLGMDVDIDDVAPDGPGGGPAGVPWNPDFEPIPVGLPEIVDDEATGTGDGSWIAPIVRRYRGQIQYCYENALKRDPTLAGRVEVAVEVDQGRVVDAYILSDTMDDAGVTSCMLDKVERWRFSGGREERSASFTWPYIFRPAE